MHEDLITIGELSTRTRLSPKALRLYGDRGLLAPTRVDPHTGIRRYGLAQAERARRIALLRAVGMPLARIAAVLDADGDEPPRLLDAYWREQESAHTARREAVGYARAVLTGRGSTMYRIAEREVPEQKVLCLRRRVTAAGLVGFIGEAGESLLAHLESTDACLSGPIFAVFHGHVDEDSDGPVEVCAPTLNTVEPVGRIAVRIHPAHREAYTELTAAKRDFAAMAAVHDAVGAWVAERGYERCGGNREVYYPNFMTAGPNDHVSDVTVPFRPRG
ncbi:GyrI-like small molecule binding domain-containing protein [Streptomyces sp. TLI_053]|uniref:MerR family transcriptional regulator n=1 Tax=Streptomyces sp. TLI_053 TaxID=1855352 RepID=UPI00087AC3E9|nr:MerR family transcriptional regulator [Streptomyces sp. TLI_053]SDT74901.1 GyrI-like small molecule binding domain-containing protein [Streptomyces sp. TLI_053]